jgi:chromate reductase
VGASTGAFGAVWSQAELRKVLAAIGARVLECEVACRHAAASFDEEGRLVDEEARAQLGEAVERLVEAARAREEAWTPASVAA